MTPDEFFQMFCVGFGVAGAAIGARRGEAPLSSLTGVPQMQTSRPASDAIYDTCRELPWLNFIISKRGRGWRALASSACSGWKSPTRCRWKFGARDFREGGEGPSRTATGGMTTERVFIVGSPGTGKSTKARDLTKAARRRISIDPSGDWAATGVKRVADLPALSKYIAQNYRGGFDVTYTPPRGQGALALHRISELLLAYQRQLFKRNPPTRSRLSSMKWRCASPTPMRSGPSLGGFNELVTQSRHVGVSVYGVTQHPTSVALMFRGLCERRFFFALHDAGERDVVAQTMGRQWMARHAALRDFECLTMLRGVVSVEKPGGKPQKK